MRTLAAIAVLGATLQSCIIYEERVRWCDEDADCPPATTGVDEPTGASPTTPDPDVAADLLLTVGEAPAGATLLTVLQHGDSTLNLENVASVDFTRDVLVTDMVARPDEVVLLIEVAAEATPGQVDVLIQTTSGAAWLLAEPFLILPPADDTTATIDTAAPTDTGAP